MRMAHKNEVNRRIDRLRKEVKLSQVSFGEKIGVTQASASRKLAGKAAFFPDEILRCAEMFGVTTDYIYGREEKKVEK